MGRVRAGRSGRGDGLRYMRYFPGLSGLWVALGALGAPLVLSMHMVFWYALKIGLGFLWLSPKAEAEGSGPKAPSCARGRPDSTGWCVVGP